MTRVLAELLEAREPMFRHSLERLESMAGHPKTDIRLTTEIHRGMRAKIHELGLDGHDTTGHELFAALGTRLRADEMRYRAAIGVTIESLVQNDDVARHVIRALSGVIQPKTCFALKPAVAKKFLRSNIPKKTMKTLGYRSADSMLKHESSASLIAAASLLEGLTWHKAFAVKLGKLKATDFELRDVILEQPASKRWHEFSESVVSDKQHFVIGVKELGTVVVLPLPAVRPNLSALTTSVLILHAVNDIRVASSYLRLHQMESGFGAIVREVSRGEPEFISELVGQPIGWGVLHQFFARIQQLLQTGLFEPLLSAEELGWTAAEHTLSRIEPTLEFWHDTDHLGLRNHRGELVSCNLTDALLSHANQFTVDMRVNHYFKKALRAEMLLRYLSDDKPRKSLLQNLQMQMATVMVTIE